MKNKTFNLVFSILAGAFAVLTFVGLAFKFCGNFFTFGNSTKFVALTRGDWFEILKLNSSLAAGYFQKTSANLAFWQISRVLMIITFVVVVLAAVFAIIRLFVNNKVVNLLTKVLGITGIVFSVLFLICFVAGGLMVSNFTNLINVYIPYVGPVWIMLFGMLSSVFTLVSCKKQKKA